MQGKGYWQEELEEAFRRYFPPAELEALRAEHGGRQGGEAAAT